MSVPVEGWTEARFWTYIRSLLRKGYNKYPPKYQALNLAKVKAPVGQRGKWRYRCNHCKQLFTNTQVKVDHIVPTGTLKSWEDLPVFAKKLFCTVDELQVLCDDCHNLKTYIERYGGDEAAYQKMQWMKEKLKQRANDQKLELSGYHYSPDQVANAEKRQQCYEELYDKLFHNS